MNHTSIYDKTEKGREEIATRKYHLASRMRSLLVLIDGKHNLADLLGKVSGLGLNDEHVRELQDGEFIYLTNPVPEIDPAPTPEAIADADIAHSEQFLALSRFYTDAIRENIGLRGYSLQLKVERAATLQDFADLRKPFLETIIKSADSKKARLIRDQLDQLLFPGEKKSGPDSILANPLK
jgi:hypothetical protein